MIRSIFTQRIDWHGITVEVAYEPDWLDMGDEYEGPTAHLQIRSVDPERAPLPITESGYRSHFLPASAVTDAGGPLAFARAWLDEVAQSKAWVASVEEARQFELF